MDKMWRLLVLTTVLTGCRDAPGEEPKTNRAVGRVHGTEFVVATGQFVRAAGRVVQYNGRPVDLALAPDGKMLYVKDSTQLAVIRVSDWTIRQTLALPENAVGSMHGLAVSRDGSRVEMIQRAQP